MKILPVRGCRPQPNMSSLSSIKANLMCEYPSPPYQKIKITNAPAYESYTWEICRLAMSVQIIAAQY
jgi:hypothetical protein